MRAVPGKFDFPCIAANVTILAFSGSTKSMVAMHQPPDPSASRAAVSRRLLQAAIAAGGLVPVSAGLAGVVVGAAGLGLGGDLSADSHVRYLSGLLLGIGLAFWSAIPNIETRTARIRLLTAIVVIGGLARLLAFRDTGTPSVPMLGAIVMELVVTPLICLWQSTIARR